MARLAWLYTTSRNGPRRLREEQQTCLRRVRLFWLGERVVVFDAIDKAANKQAKQRGVVLHHPATPHLPRSGPRESPRISLLTTATYHAFPALHITDRCPSEQMAGCLRRAAFFSPKTHRPHPPSLSHVSRNARHLSAAVAHAPHPLYPHNTTGLVTSSRSSRPAPSTSPSSRAFRLVKEVRVVREV